MIKPELQIPHVSQFYKPNRRSNMYGNPYRVMGADALTSQLLFLNVKKFKIFLKKYTLRHFMLA